MCIVSYCCLVFGVRCSMLIVVGCLVFCGMLFVVCCCCALCVVCCCCVLFAFVVCFYCVRCC